MEQSTDTMIDLETAKDKLRQSLTRLEDVVEKKLADAQARAQDGVQADMSSTQEEMNSLKDALTQAEDKLSSLASVEEKLLQAEGRAQQLQHKNTQAKEKVAALSRYMQTLSEKTAQEVSSEVQHASR